MASKFIIFLILFFSFTLNAETLNLVTGEYAPFTGELLNGGGVSTQIVNAAFNEVNQKVKVEFIPWNRAMVLLKNKSADGSFPWVRNAEREKDFIFSDPVHTYRIISFVKKGSELEKNFTLQGKKLCQPGGWDISFLEKTAIKKNVAFTMERPINLESCLQMLALGRVDLIAVNEHVGRDMIVKLFPKNPPVKELDNNYYSENYQLHFIVSKTHPQANQIMTAFNRGLGMLRKNGKYDKLIKELSIKAGFKSSCETCSRLGSL